MRLLHIQTPLYPYPHIGGIERLTRDIADSLSERKDIEQRIICLNTMMRGGEYICRSETVWEKTDGIDVVRCGCIRKDSAYPVSAVFHSDLKKLLAEYSPDIILFHSPNPAAASFLLKCIRGKTKLIVFWHREITEHRHLGMLLERQNADLCTRADRIVISAPQQLEASRYLSLYPRKCVVIPPYFTEQGLAVTARAQEKAKRIREKFLGKTLVYADGMHEEYKGMKYLVMAARQLDSSYDVLIGGEGRLTGELFLERDGDPKVHMLGRTDNDTRIACMLACDIFAFPSVTDDEIFARTLVEGMYFGKPAVTFNIPGSCVNYVSVANETGIECPNADSLAIAQAFRKLADDDELRRRYGEAARGRVLSRFTYSSFMERINDLISDISR